jgi:hypothetical protein
MSGKVWRKESFQRPEKTWLHSRKITKKLAFKLLREREKNKVDFFY